MNRVLNSQNPIFAEWLRKPLQAELFGTHTAGEEFFVSLQQLLGRGDSSDLADLIEIHYLCLLLGFGGRYSAGNRGELAQIMNMTGEKIRRIRGRFGALSPAWQPPKEKAVSQTDPVGEALGHHRGGLRRGHGAPVCGLYVRPEFRGVAVADPGHAGEGVGGSHGDSISSSASCWSR